MKIPLNETQKNKLLSFLVEFTKYHLDRLLVHNNASIEKLACIIFSYRNSGQKIIEICSSYNETKLLLDESPLFKKIQNIFTFDELIAHLASNACSIIDDEKIVVDPNKVTKYLDICYECACSNRLEYTASVLITGIRLNQEIENLNLIKDNKNDISIYLRKRDQKTLPDTRILSPDTDPTIPKRCLTELCVSGTIAIKSNKLDLQKAEQNSNDMMHTMRDAIQIATQESDILLSHVILENVLHFSFPKTTHLFLTPGHTLYDIDQTHTENISKIYKALSTDNALKKSVHRFCLGCRRIGYKIYGDIIDKLIDIVIAWEIILTSGNKNELSYRFSLHGALAIFLANRETDKDKIYCFYKKMKFIYDLRSEILHGSSYPNNSNFKEKESGFNSLSDVCNFIELNYYKLVYWLIDMDYKERPYKNKDSWLPLILKVSEFSVCSNNSINKSNHLISPTFSKK